MEDDQSRSSEESFRLTSFGDLLGYLEKQKAITRYRTTISNHIRESEAELLEEMKLWRRTASWDQFWTEMQRELAKPNNQKSCVDYATIVLRAGTASVIGQYMSCTTSETENGDSSTCTVPTGATNFKDTSDTFSLPKKQQPPQGSI
ncbi:hypothetical protein G6F46_009051 [Rhizopus delemar]|nr:hypothetical protein G6F55_008203 [Rhizopus delemar]KAG1539316.1 hypothetical protein G6F51_009214 [Rhizopus arrhizus]KAG1493210.1 hypothetical protein G6F54_008747 [Rhizopus delemar]KAG1507676.1 hypothetical protein G6F53_008769 [Rhizopus delemar]KAG1512429.1 hypothetical protein G6F52_010411 [Rhizopus delemar]